MFILIYTTIESEKDAKRIAKEMISQKLVSLVNILPKVTSIYEYKDEVISSAGIIMLMKTPKSLEEAAKKYITIHHPQENPIISIINIESVNEQGGDWLLRASGGFLPTA